MACRPAAARGSVWSASSSRANGCGQPVGAAGSGRDRQHLADARAADPDVGVLDQLGGVGDVDVDVVGRARTAARSRRCRQVHRDDRDQDRDRPDQDRVVEDSTRLFAAAISFEQEVEEVLERLRRARCRLGGGVVVDVRRGCGGRGRPKRRWSRLARRSSASLGAGRCRGGRRSPRVCRAARRAARARRVRRARPVVGAAARRPAWSRSCRTAPSARADQQDRQQVRGRVEARQRGADVVEDREEVLDEAVLLEVREQPCRSAACRPASLAV